MKEIKHVGTGYQAETPIFLLILLYFNMGKSLGIHK